MTRERFARCEQILMQSSRVTRCENHTLGIRAFLTDGSARIFAHAGECQEWATLYP